MGTEVATVVALRHGRVLLVTQPRGGVLALPGGRVEAGETAREAAARELAEETGIVVAPGALADLGLALPGAGGVTLRPFALFEAPRPSAPAELAARWTGLETPAGTSLAPGVARSVHAALALAGKAQAPPGGLLEWWRGRAAAFPWRATRDPYAVLVCEVMSQQTQIERVRERWERWMERWPTAAALAAASPGEVLRAWQGLGYPRRARDLHACAQRIASEGWPQQLTDLPGVGPYTADAIRCFAFEEPVLPRDANVRRVLERRFPGGIAGASWALGGALMDVGRTHCRARPRCGGCPLARGCLVALEGSWDPASRPRRQAPYAGSLRARRGALLRAALAGERPAAAGDPDAARTLVADGLLALRDGVLVEPAAIVAGGAMVELIVHNLVRRIGRTMLTAFGVGLGVAMIVALLSVSDGITHTAAGFAHLGGSDLGVFQAGVSDPTVSILPTSQVARLERNPDVARATPLLLIVGKVRHAPSAFVFGVQRDGFFAQRLVFATGGYPGRGAIAIGSGLAGTLHLGVGDSLVVDGRRLTVSGVYHSGITYEDEGGVLPLAVAQALAGEPRETTSIAVELTPNASAAAARASITRQFPHTIVIATGQEAARAGANGALIHNATLVIVIIALILGAVSVTNTMAMSVLERQGELALLSTVGWSNPRIAALVVGEGVGVSLLGAALGLLLGVLGSILLVDLMGVGAYVSPSVTAWGLGRGLLVGVTIGVLGGLYPAWRVTRMTPLQGLARAG